MYSRWALHHLPDFWKALALHRTRRILRDGGVLRLSDVVYSFDPSEAEERIEHWCATLPSEAANGDDWVRADIEEHVRDEHSTFTWLLEAMMERSGFRIEDVDTPLTGSSPSTSHGRSDPAGRRRSGRDPPSALLLSHR